MTRFGGRSAHDKVPPAAPAEDPVERQYRYLFRTAPDDALEAAHLEALTAVPEQVRAAVLATVQDVLVAGHRLTTADLAPLARLVTAGERRTPGTFLTACPSVARRSLAEAILASEAAFGLFAGYAAWDGAEPEPADIGVANGGDHIAGGADPAATGKYLAQSHSQAAAGGGGGY